MEGGEIATDKGRGDLDNGLEGKGVPCSCLPLVVVVVEVVVVVVVVLRVSRLFAGCFASPSLRLSLSALP